MSIVKKKFPNISPARASWKNPGLTRQRPCIRADAVDRSPAGAGALRRDRQPARGPPSAPRGFSALSEKKREGPQGGDPPGNKRESS